MEVVQAVQSRAADDWASDWLAQARDVSSKFSVAALIKPGAVEEPGSLDLRVRGRQLARGSLGFHEDAVVSGFGTWSPIPGNC